jgi:hypothetical protein
MDRMSKSLKAFLRDERGAVLAETLITLPILVWAYIGLVVYWDVFATLNASQKAAYSVLDLVSRQPVVTTTYINGLQNVLDYLVEGDLPTKMRITSIQYDHGDVPEGEENDPSDDKINLLFSLSPGNKVTELYTQVSVQELKDRLPTLDDGEPQIIVESWVDYKPDFDTGALNFAPSLTDFTFYNFTFARPRVPRVCLQGAGSCD